MKEAPLFNDIAKGPASADAYWLQTDDKLRIRVGLWQSEMNSSGTVFILPGRTGYIERYGRIANKLAERGFASFVIDWRGHGLSDRLTKDQNSCHVDHFVDYQHDVNAMVNAAQEMGLPKPWFALSNSMGGCIALRALQDGLDVRACAFIAPMWGIKLTNVQRRGAWILSWLSKTFGMAHRYAPGYDGNNYVLNTQFEDNTMTSNPDMYRYWLAQAHAKPDLVIGGPSMGWLFQSLNECKRLSDLCSPSIPCIAFCGDQGDMPKSW